MRKKRGRGRPSFWQERGYESLRTWRLPEEFCDNNLLAKKLETTRNNAKFIIQKKIEEMIKEIAPRKDKARAKEAYKLLNDLKTFIDKEV